MSTWMWVVIAVIAAVIVVAALIAMVRAARGKRRTGELQRQFGTEYGRAIDSAGSRRKGEEDLRARRAHREGLEIRELSQPSKDRYLARWKVVQAQFIDEPQIAVASADSLIKSVMSERGYPVDDFDQREADISVDHPDLVEQYREANRLAHSGGDRPTSTEALRQAMQRYRPLFEELVEAHRGWPSNRDRRAVDQERRVAG